MKAQVMEHFLFAFDVAEAYVSELDFALNAFKLNGVFTVNDIGLFIHNFREAFNSRYTAAELLAEINNRAD